MAKLTLNDGNVIEGSIEEIAEALRKGVSETVYRKVKEEDAKEGNFVKFLSNDDDEAITVGNYYRIINFDEWSDPQIVDDNEDDFDCGGEDFEVYELVSGGKATAEPTRLQVGDYAKVVEHDNDNYFGGKPGDIVKVVAIHSVRGYKVEELDGGNYNGDPNAKKEALVKATDEEVTQAREKAKWAKIGRKVNEFKAGDIVKTPYNGIIEISRIDNGNVFPIRFNRRDNTDDGFFRYANLEIIVPVESRFDRESK